MGSMLYFSGNISNCDPLVMPQLERQLIFCPNRKKKSGKRGNAFYPFCSGRCEMIDLDQWLEGKYSIKGSDLF